MSLIIVKTTVNIIAESMLTRFNSDGCATVIMKYALDHKTDSTTYDKEDKHVYYENL